MKGKVNGSAGLIVADGFGSGLVLVISVRGQAFFSYKDGPRGKIVEKDRKSRWASAQRSFAGCHDYVMITASKKRQQNEKITATVPRSMV